MKRIENIEQLISELDYDGIIFTINILDVDQSKFDPGITFEDIREMITERYNRSQKDLFKVEEAVLSLTDIHKVVFTDEFVADMRERVKEWLIPLESIFNHFNYSFNIDYINECIILDYDNCPDFQRRLGLKHVHLFGSEFNSFFFNKYEAGILRLYQVINRNNTINKITVSSNTK